ncbi:hypothetical protein ABPG74_001284 [Tetrahymena malaccensis]
MNSCGQIKGDIYYCQGSSCQSHGNVWGSNPYTNDSNKCLMAKHSGIIGSSGNYFMVIPGNNLSSFSGTSRNGVTTINYGQFASVTVRSLNEQDRSQLFICKVCSAPLKGDFKFNPSGYTTGTYLGLQCYFQSDGFSSWVYYYCQQCYNNSQPKQITEYQSACQQLKSEIAAQVQQISNLTNQLSQSQRQVSQISDSIQEKDLEIQNIKFQLDQTKEQLEQQKNSIINEKDKQIKDLHSQINQYQEEIQKLTARQYSNIQNSFSGANNSINSSSTNMNNSLQKQEKSDEDNILEQLNKQKIQIQNINNIFSESYDHDYLEYLIIQSFQQYCLAIQKFKQAINPNTIQEKFNLIHLDYINQIKTQFNNHLAQLQNMINEITCEVKKKLDNIDIFYQQTKSGAELNNFDATIQQQLLDSITLQKQFHRTSDETLFLFEQSLKCIQQQFQNDNNTS